MVKMTKRLELIKCGKAGCKSCPHGPYLYGYFRVDGCLRKKYLGRPIEPVKNALPFYEKLLIEGKFVPEWVCLEVIGAFGKDSFTVMRRKYREMVRKFCPHSGCYNEKLYRLAKEAWDQLRGSRR